VNGDDSPGLTELAGSPRRASILGVMSAETVELVRAFYGYTAGRDLVEALADEQYVAAGHAAFGELAAPDFEFVLVRGEGGEQGIYPGPSGVVTGMSDWLSSFSSYAASVENIIDLGERVLALTDERGVSRVGRVPVRQQGAVLWSFRGSKVARIETYLQRSAAFAALKRKPRS
jgi:ketosteroid isomerase-like protein